MSWARDWHRKRKEDLVAYKGGKCFDCGGVFPACCYDFDHRDPKEKCFMISTAHAAGKVSQEEIKKEADKCDLVCANCHRIRTQGCALISEKISAATKNRAPWNKNKENPYSPETLKRMGESQSLRFKREKS
jgi:hypothetical protein